MASIFSKIIQGELPCHKLFENEEVISFLTIQPINPGHCLVVPKVEVDYFIDVPEPYYSAVFQTAKWIAPALQKATGAKRIATCTIGLEVPHFHYHLIPINAISDMNFAHAKNVPQEELAEMRVKILRYLV